jgi:hypothetical protein
MGVIRSADATSCRNGGAAADKFDPCCCGLGFGHNTKREGQFEKAVLLFALSSESAAPSQSAEITEIPSAIATKTRESDSHASHDDDVPWL